MSDFFEKVLSGITSFTSGLTNRLMYSLKKLRIKKQMEDTQSKRIQIMSNLGELVYNLYTKGNVDIPECVPMCEKLSELSEKITALQAESDKIEVQTIVPKKEDEPKIDAPDTAVCTDYSHQADTASAEL